MVYCFNPQCSQPQNPDSLNTCQSCGSVLSLKERYRATQPLGQGGFGRTFLGIDQHLPDRPACVIKQLYLETSQPEIQRKAIELFQQEAVRLSELGSHPQIPTLQAYFEDQGQLYLVQELIEGQTLKANSWQNEPNKEAKALQLLWDLLPVLEFIHDRQIIHRDIKPENIIQRQNGQLVLIDFGVARVLTNTALIGGATIIGTPGFMSPEQMRGKVLPASDLYSLGVTCLNLITGMPPEPMFDIINERWQWRNFLPQGTTISPQLTKIINQLVEPSLRQRAQSAKVILRELGIFSSPDQGVISIPNPPPPPVTMPGTNPNSPTQQINSRPRDRKSKSPFGINWLERQESTGLDPEMVKLQEKLAQLEPEAEKVPEIKIDYTHLKELLSHRRWREADDETWSILCQLVGKKAGAYLYNSELEKLPCQDLKAIDLLWSKYSQGHFGFKIQKEIYEEVEEQYDLFCDRVGWSIHDDSTHSYLKFNPKQAPPGHLPSRRWVGGSMRWKHIRILGKRLQECNI